MSSRPRRAATLGVKYNEDASSSSYPDGKPDTPFEKMIQTMNNQAFPSAKLAHIDDLVVYAMFATKARPESYRAIKPDTISGASMTADEAGLFNGTVKQRTESRYLRETELSWYVDVDNSNPTFPACQEAAKAVISKLPHLFEEKSYKVLVHTILRYKLLYSAESNIQLEKVVFGDGPISGGLRARTSIRAGAYLLYACGCMSSNRHKPGHATIEATTQQLGPTGSRLILGPLRFVNHDCNPNSQLYPIPNSHAFTIITLKQIEAGQSITVKYTEGGYWGDCWCGTCKGYSTLMLPRHDTTPQAPNPNKKQRRGGKRKTVSLNGVHVRIANNRGRLNIAPEHVPPSFVVPELPERFRQGTSGAAVPPLATLLGGMDPEELEEGEIPEYDTAAWAPPQIGTSSKPSAEPPLSATSSKTQSVPPPSTASAETTPGPAQPTESGGIYDMPSPLSSIDEDSDSD
ncbi:hypothetical protein B0H11DRAFT_2024850 [Mycena galericulata]|nr:hypothetical protein B0H11DRAFT_2024850 [Mycena galericulata]